MTKAANHRISSKKNNKEGIDGIAGRAENRARLSLSAYPAVARRGFDEPNAFVRSRRNRIMKLTSRFWLVRLGLLVLLAIANVSVPNAAEPPCEVCGICLLSDPPASVECCGPYIVFGWDDCHMHGPSCHAAGNGCPPPVE